LVGEGLHSIRRQSFWLFSASYEKLSVIHSQFLAEAQGRQPSEGEENSKGFGCSFAVFRCSGWLVPDIRKRLGT